MATPAVQHGIVGCDLQAAGECPDGFAVLPHPRLGDAELDDLLHVARIGGEGALGAGDGACIGLRAVLHARARAVLQRLAARGRGDDDAGGNEGGPPPSPIADHEGFRIAPRNRIVPDSRSRMANRNGRSITMDGCTLTIPISTDVTAAATVPSSFTST